jgi:integrase
LPWAQLPRFWKALDEVEGLGACALRLAILAAVARDALIFPSATRKTPISDMTISAVIRRMNAARGEGDPPPWRDPDGRAAVPHGFRATFSTWGDDMRPHEREAIERALAHEVENKVSGAYRRSDLFDRRVALMAEWAAHVVSGATAVSASVVETPASATAQG